MVLLALACGDDAPTTAPARVAPAPVSEEEAIRARRFLPQNELERDYVERVEERLPDPQIERLDSDRLRISWGDDQGSDVNLRNLRGECDRSPATCSDSIDTWVATLAEEARPLAREEIRMVLMGERIMREQGHSALEASQPFAGDLRWHFVQDTPTAIRSLTRSSLTEAGFDVDGLRATALSNMQRVFGPLRYAPLADAPALVYAVDTSGDGLLSDSYDNSRLLMHDAWAPVAQMVRGELIAVAPARDIVLFCGADEAGALSLLRYLATRMVAGEPHPVSAQLVRWTSGGWVAFE